MRNFKLLFSFFFITALLSCDKEDHLPDADTDDPGISENVIKDKAAFPIGAAVTRDQLRMVQFSNTLREHYNQITAEYEMKMRFIWEGENSYSWSRADEIVNYANNNNMEVHGHTLVWYKSFPDWFINANYDSAKFESLVKGYIETVVSRYKGKVRSWDVANEIFLDNGSLRTGDCPVAATFNDPIAFYGRCYQYTRNIDPDAKLFYNDYNVVLASGKRTAMKQMVGRFRVEGYPIDGLGDQFHYMVSTNRNTIKDGLADMATTGLMVHISELDIRANVNQDNNYIYSLAEQQKHAEAYQQIVEFFESMPQSQKFAISTWGLTDRFTWLTGYWHEKEYPLLFDQSYQKKLAYEGFLKGLKSPVQ